MTDQVGYFVSTLQLVIATVVSLYLLQVFSILDLGSGPFSDVFIILQTVPWLILALAALAFVSMILGVFD